MGATLWSVRGAEENPSSEGEAGCQNKLVLEHMLLWDRDQRIRNGQ